MANNGFSPHAPEFVAFAARGVNAEDASAHLERARRALADDQFRLAVETLIQTRVLSWDECMQFARLLRPVNQLN
ncbi:MAG TPA: hypothetical protein VGH11_10325 [Jatrophihabitans sp.]|jgi:hypothetical protein